MTRIRTKEDARLRRKKRIRKKVLGTTERPRLSVHRTLNHIYVQAIDDLKGRTIVMASSLDELIKEKAKNSGNKETAKLVGELIARRCRQKGIERVVFDRGGYLYHGRVKALAEAARTAGLKF